jgi:hypothetical protein
MWASLPFFFESQSALAAMNLEKQEELLISKKTGNHPQPNKERRYEFAAPFIKKTHRFFSFEPT